MRCPERAFISSKATFDESGALIRAKATNRDVGSYGSCPNQWPCPLHHAKTAARYRQMKVPDILADPTGRELLHQIAAAITQQLTRSPDAVTGHDGTPTTERAQA